MDMLSTLRKPDKQHKCDQRADSHIAFNDVFMFILYKITFNSATVTQFVYNHEINYIKCFHCLVCLSL